jgi:glycosyltransferase involved in cell wall biosynthesis
MGTSLDDTGGRPSDRRSMRIGTPHPAAGFLAANGTAVPRSSAKPPSVNHGGRRERNESARARLSFGLPELPTIAAAGPFDDMGHAQRLAAMFTAVQQSCRTQILLLGAGARRSVVEQRAVEHRLQTRLLVEDCYGQRRSQLLATADIVILSPSSGPATVIEMMAAGRALVAAANPVTAQLLMPCSAGLLYRPGDGSAMTAAVVRLLTHAELRMQMGSRASQVAELNTAQPTGSFARALRP